MVRLFIMKTGTTFPDIAAKHGDFDAFFIQALQHDGVEIFVRDIAAGESLPTHDEADAVVVTGSPAMVTDRAPWSEAAAEWLAHWTKGGKPVLAVCYGHQLLAHALGGRVGPQPHGREMGTLDVMLADTARDDPLFASVPSTFPAHLTHRQSVVELPPGAKLLAQSALESHQAFRVGDCAWGVQFHPEFDEQVMMAYIDLQHSVLAQENRDPEGMKSGVRPTPDASSVLKRFVDLITE